jgi:glycerate-2-kinase
MPSFKYIKNDKQLLSHGNAELRAKVLDILEAGLAGADPGPGTYKSVTLTQDYILVNQVKYDLNKIEKIYVVGSGKGSFSIAEALENILGSRIHKGFIVVKKGDHRRLKRIEVMEAGHPIPDENSVIGARKILEIIKEAGEKDIVFAAITGGCSALTVLLPNSVALSDYQELTGLLLGSGAIIRDINAVRKHICRLKGGRLVKYIQPAVSITLTLDTKPKGMLWPDMSLPDESTFQEAIDVLKNKNIWNKVSSSIQNHLLEGTRDPEMETLKSLDNMKAQLVSVSDQIITCEAAAHRARHLGFEPTILSTSIQGEASDVGICLAGIAREIVLRNRPFTSPCVLISGGETTVSLDSNSGLGGPNQEFVLAFALEMEGPEFERVVCVSVDTDGTDGPTEIAGGIVDHHTCENAKNMGLTMKEYLKMHNSSEFLSRLEDAIITGHTGTNVLNLRIVAVDG